MRNALKIAFFGASVTAQGIARNGDLNGYVDHFQKLCGTNISVVKHGFGSCQFHSMGRYALLSILLLKPDILVLEWHTTGEEKHSIEQWAKTLILCLACNVIPIVLVLPHLRLSPELQKYSSISSISSILEEGGIGRVIDLRYLVDKEGEILFRDVVHTNPFGASIYAAQLYASIRDIINKRLEHRESSIFPWQAKDFYEKDFSRILFSTLDSETIISTLRPLSIYNPFHECCEVSFWGRKGPVTPNIDIISSCQDVKPETKQVFDQWCYYERESALFAHEVRPAETVIIRARESIVDRHHTCPMLYSEQYKALAPYKHTQLRLCSSKLFYTYSGYLSFL